MDCILSTSASLALRLFADDPFLLVLAFEEDEKKKYRIARPPRKSTRISWGILIVWSAEDMLNCVVGCGAIAVLDVGRHGPEILRPDFWQSADGSVSVEWCGR